MKSWIAVVLLLAGPAAAQRMRAGRGMGLALANLTYHLTTSEVLNFEQRRRYVEQRGDG